MSDFIPGGDIISSIPGIDFVPGMVANYFVPGSGTLLNQFGPDFSGGDYVGADWMPSASTIGSVLSAGSHLLGGSGTGSGAGTGTGAGAGIGAGGGGGNLTADVVGGNNAPAFDLSPTMGNAPMSQTSTPSQQFFAEGGYTGEDHQNSQEQHEPQFFSEGGLKHTYVQGEGDGTSDSVPAMLASGEFVIPADIVSSLGNGSSDSGASVLDQFLKTVRDHKQSHDAKELPPDSLGPLEYLAKGSK